VGGYLFAQRKIGMFLRWFNLEVYSQAYCWFSDELLGPIFALPL
jgi:hypothetical protein